MIAIATGHELPLISTTVHASVPPLGVHHQPAVTGGMAGRDRGDGGRARPGQAPGEALSRALTTATVVQN